ncbi:hypothetical protein ACFLZ7_03525 [Nanoarchaeota archaeon]
MKRITKNRYIDAALKTIILFSIMHFIVLFVYSVANNQLVLLNLFNILDFGLFFPKIINSYLNTLFSTIVLVAVYAIIFRTSKK